SAGDGIVSVVGAAGDLVALAERDLGRVAVIDVGTDTRIAEVPLGDALLTTCFSPDGRFLAARHYQSGAVAASADDTAPALSEHVTVTELGGTPPVRRRFTIAEPVGDMTWLSPTLLAVATPTSVEVIDVDERTRTPIAQLAGASWWLLDADTPGC
ncbi:MAG: hypothetical protein S0880_01095, partial [Actinomycetota bacterium]|nr:hypothetical protein [Actinomycetota bacterium]